MKYKVFCQQVFLYKFFLYPLIIRMLIVGEIKAPLPRIYLLNKYIIVSQQNLYTYHII